jgi:transcription initiation factor TFIIE subunit alpha
MQRFNIATASIRDALKAVEGVRLPSMNVVAWIAQNVKAETVGEDAGEVEKKVKVKVVVGGEGDEAERLKKEREAEEQR